MRLQGGGGRLAGAGVGSWGRVVLWLVEQAQHGQAPYGQAQGGGTARHSTPTLTTERLERV